MPTGTGRTPSGHVAQKFFEAFDAADEDVMRQKLTAAIHSRRSGKTKQ